MKQLLFIACCTTAFAQEPVLEKTVSFTGSFLYWQPIQDGMDVAFLDSGISNSTLNTLSVASGTLIQMPSLFKPGFQIGVDYLVPCDHWDLCAQWTRLHGENHKSASRTANTSLFTNWVSPLIGEVGHAVDSFRYQWQLNTDIVNLELGRECLVGKLVFRPFVGATAAWLKQVFSGISNNLGGTGLNTQMHNSSMSWELGPRLGVQTQWLFGKGFSLISNLAGDLLYAHYDLKIDQSGINNSTVFLQNTLDLDAFRPVLETYLGARWERLFSKGLHSLAISVRYDFQCWWNQNMIKWFTDVGALSAPQGNLYLQGATGSAEIAF